MRVQLISKDNGVGLTQDMAVIKEAILMAHPDAVFTFSQWNKQPVPARYDVNIHLELVGTPHMAQSDWNILVPNPEWFMSHMWGAQLPKMNAVWCKTMDCLEIFSRMHKRAIYSGWTSVDIHDSSVARKKRMLHVAGLSSAKGTTEVMAAMAKLPNIELVLITREPRNIPALPNVHVVMNPDDTERIRLQNECLVHLCPSSYEGFGHYLNEARACGAVIITTNAAPMNELVSSEFGCTVSVASNFGQNLAIHSKVNPEALVRTIPLLMDAAVPTLETIGARARQAYLDGRSKFHEFVKQYFA